MLRKILLNYLLLSFSIFITEAGWAINNYPIRVSPSKVNSRLVGKNVFDVFTDRYGVLWICTEEGLNSYDGYNLTTYLHDEVDTTSLSGHFVKKIIEDKFGNLWVGTNNGLAKYNRATRKFKSFRLGSDEDRPNYNYIWSLLEDGDGDIWVAMNNGVFRLNQKNGKFEKGEKYPEYENKVCTDNKIFSIFRSKNGVLWFPTFLQKGLSNLNPRDNKIKTYLDTDKHNPSDSRFYSAAENKEGDILFCNEKESWMYYAKKDTFEKLDISYTGKIKGNAILHDGTFVIATATRISFINRVTGEVRINDIEKNLEGDAKILSLYVGHSGILWIGTTNGLFEYHSSKQVFKNIPYPSVEGGHELGSNVLHKVNDSTGIVWFKAGAFSYNLNSFKWESKIVGIDKNIRHLCETEPQRYLLQDAGQNFYNAKYHNNEIKTSLISSTIMKGAYNIYIKIDDTYLIFDLWGGYKTDLALTRLDTVLQFSDKASGVVLEQANDSILWIGTLWRDLHKLNIPTGKVTVYKALPGEAESLGDKNVNCLKYDKKRNLLWIGTRMNGLNVLDLKTQKFKRINIKDGLLSNNIHSVELDKNGNVWILTINNVTCYIPESGEIKNFIQEDGLVADHFKGNAISKMSDNVMAILTNKGLIVFNVDDLLANSAKPRLYIVDFKTKAKEGGVIHHSLNSDSVLYLDYDQNAFSFELAVTHYGSPERNLFAYKLDGFDRTWNVNSAEKRFGTYTSLEPGTYTLRLKGASKDKVWTNEKVIKIIISPPFWDTLWFKTLVGIIVFGIGFLFYRNRMNQVKSVRLEKEVNERTKELLMMNQEMEAQNEEIRAINEELEVNKEQLEGQNQKINSLFYELQDSVKTALVIQESILPNTKKINGLLESYFIVYKPKDIVSGDFYWIEGKDDKIYVATVDCTGHGVAGGFMSMIGFNLLSNILHNASADITAAEVLNKLNVGVIELLQQRDEESKSRDGMDITLLIFDKEMTKVNFSGAFNPLYLIREGELLIHRTNKFSIGVPRKNNSIPLFDDQYLDLKKEDMIYIFSDGYADQLGGEDGMTKFMYKRFRDMLINIQSFDNEEQKLVISKSIDDWRDEFEQTDDVLVMGIKIV